jgi:flagellar secretion chaperone FliS
MFFLQNQSVTHDPVAASHGAVLAAHRVDLRPLDAALASLESAADCMQGGADTHAQWQLGRALGCVAEFRAGLDLCAGGPPAAHLDDLCEYVLRQLSAARRQNRMDPVMEVSHLLHEVRAAWVTLSHV